MGMILKKRGPRIRLEPWEPQKKGNYDVAFILGLPQEVNKPCEASLNKAIPGASDPRFRERPRSTSNLELAGGDLGGTVALGPPTSPQISG